MVCLHGQEHFTLNVACADILRIKMHSCLRQCNAKLRILKKDEDSLIS